MYKRLNASFLIATFPIILGMDALCLIDLGAFLLEPRKRYFMSLCCWV